MDGSCKLCIHLCILLNNLMTLRTAMSMMKCIACKTIKGGPLSNEYK